MLFTADGLVDFLKKLGSDNRGLVLRVLDPDLTSIWQILVMDMIAERLQGRLDFTSNRKLNSEMSNSDDDTE